MSAALLTLGACQHAKTTSVRGDQPPPSQTVDPNAALGDTNYPLAAYSPSVARSISTANVLFNNRKRYVIDQNDVAALQAENLLTNEEADALATMVRAH